MGFLYKFILTFFFIIFVYLLNKFWKNRNIYYCYWKLPGPLAFPFIGSIILITSAYKDVYKTFTQICQSQKSIFKLVILNELYVVNSEPEDIEVLLNTCLGKPFFYDFWNKMVNDKITLITAPVHIWKKERKEFNQAFNTKILNIYYEIFIKYSKKLVKDLHQTCGQVQTDFLSEIWKCNVDIFFETMGDLDPQLIQERYDILELVVRAGKIIVEKFKKPWLMVDFFFWLSPLREKTTSLATEGLRIGKKVFILKLKQFSDDKGVDIIKDDLRMKRFFNQLYTILNTKSINSEDLQAEGIMMTIAATETSAIAITTVILALGFHQDIQEKVYREISSICPNTHNFSLEDINRMEYLERVIKETLRLFPVAPLIMRSVDQDTKLKSYVQPAGSHVAIPIDQIHKNPELWPNPLKFDPDRFLPEEVKKRHRCAYLPFSFGPRNCIGIKYAMMSMKCMLAQIVKNFVIKTLDINSLEDIEFEYKVLQHPKNYRIVCEKRSK